MLSPSSPVVHVPGVNDMQAPSPAGQSMSQISRQLSQSQAAWAGSRPPFPGQVQALRTVQSPGASGQSAQMRLVWVLALRLAPCSETDPSWASRSTSQGRSWWSWCQALSSEARGPRSR